MGGGGGERKGRNTREQEREGKKKGKEQKKGFIKTTKDTMSRREKKRQKWIKTDFYIERDGTNEQNQPTTHRTLFYTLLSERITVNMRYIINMFNMTFPLSCFLKFYHGEESNFVSFRHVYLQYTCSPT